MYNIAIFWEGKSLRRVKEKTCHKVLVWLYLKPCYHAISMNLVITLAIGRLKSTSQNIMTTYSFSIYKYPIGVPVLKQGW